MYKPADGHRGQGVKVFNLTGDRKSVFDKISSLREGVVEAYLVQHHALSELAPGSVNTIRIVTLSSNDWPVTKDGKMMDIAYASLRIGEGKAVVDNFHSGGMVACLDLETGEVVTDATDQEGNVFKKHPMTGTVIRGTRVPFFKEAVEMVKDAVMSRRLQGYLGWDIAVTEDGPELIEINNQPGIVLLQTPYAPEHKGMKYVLEKYL